MSETVSTSPARAPRPEPTWVASIAPIALPIMPIIGPAMAWASAGSAPLRPCTDCSATGSTSTFHTSRVSSTHSARLQAAVEVTPEAKSVVLSSQWSASRSASATASRSRWPGVGSAELAAPLRARSRATFQLSAPS